jgi:hypothetical protein
MPHVGRATLDPRALAASLRMEAIGFTVPSLGGVHRLDLFLQESRE